MAPGKGQCHQASDIRVNAILLYIPPITKILSKKYHHSQLMLNIPPIIKRLSKNQNQLITKNLKPPQCFLHFSFLLFVDYHLLHGFSFRPTSDRSVFTFTENKLFKDTECYSAHAGPIIYYVYQ